MRELSELNINEGGNAVSRPAPSDDIVNSFQTHFRLKIPDDHLKLLCHSNGGHPELDTIEIIDKSGIVLSWAVSQFYHLDEDKSTDESLWYVTKVWRNILGKDALPFAEDGGGNQFYLDLKGTPASVKICIHDENYFIVDLAPSFSAFIDALSIDPEGI